MSGLFSLCACRAFMSVLVCCVSIALIARWRPLATSVVPIACTLSQVRIRDALAILRGSAAIPQLFFFPSHFPATSAANNIALWYAHFLLGVAMHLDSAQADVPLIASSVQNVIVAQVSPNGNLTHEVRYDECSSSFSHELIVQRWHFGIGTWQRTCACLLSV